ncbi:septation ring formation regulator EzrA, partial [Staphylococcus arlettae]
LYIILAIIVIILIIIGVLFYMRSNKSHIIEKAEERKLKVEQLPYNESLSKLSDLKLTGETKSTYDDLKASSQQSNNQYL